MTSTPTPGDLSARHLAQLRDLRAFSANESYKPSLDWAIAALSALPAGGGVVAEVCMDQSGCKYLCWSPGLEELPAVGTKLCTTPQPSAAEGDGSPESAMQKVIDNVVDGVMGQREEVLRAFVAKYGFQPDEAVQVSGSDGSWRIIRRSDMYASQDAAVGAQGDECFCDARGIGAPGVSCGDCPRDYAAPAAGKGVDDVLDLATQYGDHSVDSRNRESWDFDAHGLKQLAAALTRQPVAGDGMVLVPRELTAENGAKAALIGDFSFRDGTGREHNVPWHTIKEIHRAMVAHFAVNVAPAEQAVPFDWIKTSERMPPAGEFVYTLIHKPKAKGGFAHSFGIWDRDNDSMPDAAQFRKEFAYWSPMPPLPAAPAATPTDGGEGKS